MDGWAAAKTVAAGRAAAGLGVAASAVAGREQGWAEREDAMAVSEQPGARVAERARARRAVASKAATLVGKAEGAKAAGLVMVVPMAEPLVW